MGNKPSTLEGKRIIVGLSGGIACYKIADLVSSLVQSGAVVHVVMTEAATRFVTPLTFESLTGKPVFDSMWKHIDGHTPQHINIATNADVMLIAPCTMDMVTRLACGLTNDPVTLVCSAINREQIPVVVAPSMNVTMLSQPSTTRNLTTLCDDGFTVLGTEDGWQACRATGMGRMSDSATLIAAVESALQGD
jgi:phosphopantothenoylcysteine decarboxylase/phosphopantothenate--cysteine ligase